MDYQGVMKESFMVCPACKQAGQNGRGTEYSLDVGHPSPGPRGGVGAPTRS